MVHIDVKQIREVVGIPQIQAARDLKISRNTLAKWESSPGEMPIGKLNRLLVYLGYDLEINLKKQCGPARRGE